MNIDKEKRDTIMNKFTRYSDKIIVVFALIFIIYAYMKVVCKPPTQQIDEFYISEGVGNNNKKIYILTNEEYNLIARDPELIMYCKNHVGETVKIKFQENTDDVNNTSSDFKYISIVNNKE